MKNLKTIRKSSLLTKVLFVDGQAGCGKTMLTPIISSFNRLEIFNYSSEIENICALNFLKKISYDAALSMIKIQLDLFLYETMMSRRANFRPTDVSSVFNNPNFISEIKTKLSSSLGNSFEFRRVENVGPKVSSELLRSGIIAIFLSLVAMLIYIWIRFEWQFSLGAILALFHDVIVTLGIFSLFSLEINLSIVAAVLTIVGYSMNDTVVIFDRVRENLKKYSDIKIFELTNISINETLSRTIITSVTTLLALFSIFFFGGEILKGFSLAMILGVFFGTYSSIYIANPILVFLQVSPKTISKEDEN